MMREYKRYDEYKDSGIEWLGKVPKNWSIVSMNYLVDITTGGKDTVDRNPDGKYPFFVRSDTIEKIDTYSYDGTAILTPGDGDIGAIFHYINGKFDFHQRVYKISEFKNIYPKYLYYYMVANFKSDVKKLSAKTTVDSLRMPMFKNFKVLNFSSKEQQKIASFLDQKTAEIDEIITKKEKLIDHLEKYKKSVITEAVTKGKLGDKYINEDGELVDEVETKDSGVDWIGDIPKYWNVNKAKFVADVLLSNINKKTKKYEPSVLLCNYTDVYYNDFINLNIDFMKASTSYSKKKKLSLEVGDVIITKDSESPDDIGIPTCVKETKENLVCGYHLAMLKANREIILGEFIFRLLESSSINNQFYLNATGITRYSISLSTIKNILIFYPSLDIQKQIIDYLDKKIVQIDNLIQTTKKSIEKYKEYKKLLIFEAVTGKIDLRDYELEGGEEIAEHNNSRETKREELSEVN